MSQITKRDTNIAKALWFMTTFDSERDASADWDSEATPRMHAPFIERFARYVVHARVRCTNYHIRNTSRCTPCKEIALNRHLRPLI